MQIINSGGHSEPGAAEVVRPKGALSWRTKAALAIGLGLPIGLTLASDPVAAQPVDGEKSAIDNSTNAGPDDGRREEDNQTAALDSPTSSRGGTGGGPQSDPSSSDHRNLDRSYADNDEKQAGSPRIETTEAAVPSNLGPVAAAPASSFGGLGLEAPAKRPDYVTLEATSETAAVGSKPGSESGSTYDDFVGFDGSLSEPREDYSGRIEFASWSDPVAKAAKLETIVAGTLEPTHELTKVEFPPFNPTVDIKSDWPAEVPAEGGPAAELARVDDSVGATTAKSSGANGEAKVEALDLNSSDVDQVAGGGRYKDGIPQDEAAWEDLRQRAVASAGGGLLGPKTLIRLGWAAATGIAATGSATILHEPSEWSIDMPTFDSLTLPIWIGSRFAAKPGLHHVPDPEQVSAMPGRNIKPAPAELLPGRLMGPSSDVHQTPQGQQQPAVAGTAIATPLPAATGQQADNIMNSTSEGERSGQESESGGANSTEPAEDVSASAENDLAAASTEAEAALQRAKEAIANDDGHFGLVHAYKYAELRRQRLALADRGRESPEIEVPTEELKSRKKRVSSARARLSTTVGTQAEKQQPNFNVVVAGVERLTLAEADLPPSDPEAALEMEIRSINTKIGGLSTKLASHRDREASLPRRDTLRGAASPLDIKVANIVDQLEVESAELSRLEGELARLRQTTETEETLTAGEAVEAERLGSELTPVRQLATPQSGAIQAATPKAQSWPADQAATREDSASEAAEVEPGSAEWPDWQYLSGPNVEPRVSPAERLAAAERAFVAADQALKDADTPAKLREALETRKLLSSNLDRALASAGALEKATLYAGRAAQAANVLKAAREDFAEANEDVDFAENSAEKAAAVRRRQKTLRAVGLAESAEQVARKLAAEWLGYVR